MQRIALVYALAFLVCGGCQSFKEDMRAEDADAADAAGISDVGADDADAAIRDADSATLDGDSAAAPSGVVDSTFGVGGAAVIRLPGDAGISNPRGIAVVPAGASAGQIDVFGVDLTYTGPVFTSRLSRDGILEDTFGEHGIATALAGSERYTDFYGFARDSGGRIIVSGYIATGNEAKIVRFTSSGQIDSSFGQAGVVTFPAAKVFAVSVLPNDDVFAVLEKYDAASHSDIAVAILRHDNGAPIGADPGWSLLPMPNGAHAVATAIAADGAGRFVIAGAASCPDNLVSWFNCAPFVARLRADGTLDPSFGARVAGGERSGVVMAPKPSARLEGVSLDHQGRIVAAGRSSIPQDIDRCFVMRTTIEGDLDPSFGSGGTANVDLAFGEPVAQQRCNAVSAEKNDALTIGGVVFEGGITTKVVFERLTPKGEPDKSFGTGGVVAMPFPVGANTVNGTYAGVTHDPEGRLLVLGVSADGGNAAILRLSP